MNKIFKDFYGENNTLEVCLILFDKCNLQCKFCFENHTHIISPKEVIEIGDKLIPQLEEVVIKRPYLNKFVFRLWGGELFMDGISYIIYKLFVSFKIIIRYPIHKKFTTP